MTERHGASYEVARFRDREAELRRLAAQAQIMADAEEAALQRLGLPERGRVLDLGCGPGFVGARLSKRHPALSIVGVDRDPEVLVQARSKMEVVQGDAEQLPFGANEFQCVYARLVLRHLARPEKALAEITRVLVPAGRLIVVDSDDGALVLHPMPRGFERALRAKQETARRRGGNPFIGRELPALLHRAGFADLQAHLACIDSIMLGRNAFSHIVLGPITEAIDDDLLPPSEARAAGAALDAWAEGDSFGMTTVVAFGARKNLDPKNEPHAGKRTSS